MKLVPYREVPLQLPRKYWWWLEEESRRRGISVDQLIEKLVEDLMAESRSGQP